MPSSRKSLGFVNHKSISKYKIQELVLFPNFVLYTYQCTCLAVHMRTLHFCQFSLLHDITYSGFLFWLNTYSPLKLQSDVLMTSTVWGSKQWLNHELSEFNYCKPLMSMTFTIPRIFHDVAHTGPWLAAAATFYCWGDFMNEFVLCTKFASAPQHCHETNSSKVYSNKLYSGAPT